MLKILTLCSDLLFPPRDTELLVRPLTPQSVQRVFCPGRYQNIEFLASYNTPELRALIQENKYHQNNQAALLLSSLVTLWLAKHSGRKIIIIPMPLSKKRRRARGYNQVETVLSHISVPNVQVMNAVLRRTRDTTPQTSLERVERLKNVVGAFSCNEALLKSQEPALVVLLDDVVTTGATVEAARAELALHLPAGSTLICLALAH